jgi:hypothetical protein
MLDRRQAGERHALVRRFKRPIGLARGGGGGLSSGLVLGLAAHAPAQHRIELVEHNGGEAGEDDQFEDLQRVRASGRHFVSI